MAALAAALSDASRMKILCALMDGRAWTATELSAVSDIAPSTTSAHLSRLLKANLVTCLSQGRHRYFRLYSASIASLLENMMGVSFGTVQSPKTRVPAELQRARTCYDHLAGEIAVGIYDYLVVNAWITRDGSELTPLGKAQFSQLGVMLDAKTKRKKCSACLDWSERKFHLGGHAGAALFQCFEQRGWIEKVPGYREVTVTEKGWNAFNQYFDLAKAPN
ncbi:helix-turn-helix transcriptional regulator [Photobacterium sp. TLY01]|uniref:ArsR/SmtB family transcription factor n=1 Tax=Photobacterium sp. TLY01 TaxID=2907534 RepID=UPI001F3DD172|nr:winged helix-turn-helix domain-containing protein [Photobacterium sp. TLY01]UIP27588.1 winged helix-turn-helix domain-containing protein [Photobacterium sp. TLY01]